MGAGAGAGVGAADLAAVDDGAGVAADGAGVGVGAGAGVAADDDGPALLAADVVDLGRVVDLGAIFGGAAADVDADALGAVDSTGSGALDEGGVSTAGAAVFPVMKPLTVDATWSRFIHTNTANPIETSANKKAHIVPVRRRCVFEVHVFFD